MQKEVFWLRIMAGHSKFIAHLLDPSERRFVTTARDFGRRFDELLFRPLDFESMLVSQTFAHSMLSNACSTTSKPKVPGKGLSFHVVEFLAAFSFSGTFVRWQ